MQAGVRLQFLMSGNKTRFGFAGATDPTVERENVQAARTMLGHDIHLPQFPEGRALTPDSLPPPVSGPSTSLGMPSQPVVPVPPGINEPILTDEPPKEQTKRLPVAITEEMDQVERSTRPQHSGKSNFPTIAKVFGRWTTGGGFKRQSQLDAQDDDILVPPKDPLIRNVALLLVVAVLSFLLVMFVLRLPACQDDYSSATVSAQTGPVATPTPPASQPVRPAPSPARTAPTASPSATDIALVKASLRPPAQVVAPKPAPPATGKKPTPHPPSRQIPKTPKPSKPLKSAFDNHADDLMPMRL